MVFPGLFFGDHIPDPFVAFWKRSGRKQVISQAEIFPVLVAKETWKQVIENRSILWFLDNDSARMALVRNYSPVLDNFCLLQLNAELDVKIPTRNWYSRVPSQNNPSDDASRLEFEAYSYAIQSQPCYAMALEALESFQKLTVSVEIGALGKH